ncbi:MAG: glycosyltransferase [Allosphingosinicella sp.]
MLRRLWLLAFIDDPFDPPGEARLGGGQVFMFDLGRSLVREGFDVTYVTQLNNPAKARFERLGPRCRIHRLEVGEARYRPGEEVGEEIDALACLTLELARAAPAIDVVHAQYWISGAVALRLKAEFGVPFFLYPLSFGRSKRATVDPEDRLAVRREAIEPEVLAACDHIVVATPDERDLLQRHYPGIRDDQILLAPLWSDATLFYPRPESADRYLRRAVGRFAEGA